MKSEKLFDAIGMISDDYIAEARVPIPNVKKKPSIIKLALVAVIIIFCMSFIVPTFATYVAEADEVLYRLFPSIAQKLTPVQMSCIDNGIKMEVISANVTDTDAQVFISLQDLEEERIDETTDLFDSYHIRRPFDSSATCSMVSFDESTGIATFLIQIEWTDAEKVLGSKVTFTLDEFISGKQKYEGAINGIDLANVQTAPETMSNVNVRGGSYSDEDTLLLDENSQYLVPDEKGIISPVDGATITAIGYIDGKLHIQTYYDNIREHDNHGYVYLVDKEYNSYHSEQSVAFWDKEGVGSYEEQVFDISEDKLKELTLYGYFVTCNSNTQGNWEVTFELDR